MKWFLFCSRAYGVVSMCIGTGMGAAAVFEYPGGNSADVDTPLARL